MQAYSNPKREDEPTALPDIEVWEHDCVNDCFHPADTEAEDCPGSGWFWWSCSPGCLPGSDPVGPFETEAEALADAREGPEE